MSTDAIVKIEPTVLRIPFDDGGPGHGIMPTRWHALDIVLLRVETARGLVGWGEGFGYACQHATAQVVRDMLVPFALGRDSTDPVEVNRAAQLALHLFGRFGITMFAISALDIALWDIVGKRAGMPLFRLWGAANEPPYFHHGLFTTLREAVVAHAGEAIEQRRAFERLTKYEQIAVLEFLESLQVLPSGTKSLVVDERFSPRRWPPMQ